MTHKSHRDEEEGMSPEARRDQVLSFLVRVDIPLPPLAIYAGMKRIDERVTFSYYSMSNILSDLVEQGFAKRVDSSKLKDGEIVELDDGNGRRAFYLPTEAGSERVAADSE